MFTEEACKNYYDQAGTCVLITSCKSIYQLDQNPYKSFSDTLLINGNVCGSSGATKKVCCTDSVTNEVKESNKAPFGTVNIPVTNARTTTTTVRPALNPGTTTVKPASNPSQNTSPGVLPTPGNSICGLQASNKVFGGELAEIDEHPWLARLDYTYRKFIWQIYAPKLKI